MPPHQSQGGFEHHIPATFSAERPAIAYTHEKHDAACADHPIGSQLPQPTQDRPSLVCNPAELAALFRGADGPLKMDDYLSSDRPQVSLHVVSFADKTVVVLYWPHSVFDAMGMKVMFDAWTLVLQGREAEVRPPHGWDHDALAEFGAAPKEPHVLAAKLMTPGKLVMYGLKNVLDLAWRSKENRMACIPGAFLEKLRAQALEELAAEAAEEGKEGEKPWVSEGDVLAAWWLRLAVSHIPRDSTRNVSNPLYYYITILLDTNYPSTSRSLSKTPSRCAPQWRAT